MSESAPTVAVVGGGQLARMMQTPAVEMAVPLRLLVDGPGDSAAQVIPDHLVGDYRDLDTLLKLTDGCAVVTFDHEHVPTEHLHALAQAGRAVRPGPDALVFAQDKGRMRERLTELGIPCPRWARVASADDVEAFGFPCVLKTTRGGYDGKGVWFVDGPGDVAEPFRVAAEAGVELIAEQLIAHDRELSALVARSPSGQAATYPVVATTQRGGICHEVIAPAPDLLPAVAGQAQEIAMRLSNELDVTGVLAVELFEADGGVLVNELAMRPHNTGHWTQDGAVTSQFENHLRAVLDLPLGSPASRVPWTVMVNILGGPQQDGAVSAPLYEGYPHALARDPHLRVHLYGKSLRPGRKVGHVNAYGDDLADCLERARHAAAWFAGELGNESE